jgi:hypothetical protein
MSQHRSEPRVPGASFARSALWMLQMTVAFQEPERWASELALCSANRDAAGAHVRVEARSEIHERVGHARSIWVRLAASSPRGASRPGCNQRNHARWLPLSRGMGEESAPPAR